MIPFLFKKMDRKFSFSEVDMMLVLDFCEGNFRRSVEKYWKFTNCTVPHRETFSNGERRARETGMFLVQAENAIT